MGFRHKSILPLVVLAMMTCGCGRTSTPVHMGEVQQNQRAPQALEKPGPRLTVKRNVDAETVLADLGLDAWAFEVTGVPWTWEVSISHRAKGKNRRSREVYHRSYLESSRSFYAKNTSTDSGEGAFGTVVLLLPDPVAPPQQFQDDLIVTTKLGYDPTRGGGIGRRAVRETLRTPIKEIYPASVGSYTSVISNPQKSKRFAEISQGEAVTVVDEVRDFEHPDDDVPADQRETVRIRIVISALDRE